MTRGGGTTVGARLPGAIRLVCWDLDGTLTDSVRFVVDTANAVIARHGGTALAFAEVGRMSGLPLEAIFRHAWPDLSRADAERYRDEYRALYDEVAIPATRLYRGARDAACLPRGGPAPGHGDGQARGGLRAHPEPPRHLMGRAAGARTIQVLWGYEAEAVPEADVAVRTWPELRARILRP